VYEIRGREKYLDLPELIEVFLSECIFFHNVCIALSNTTNVLHVIRYLSLEVSMMKAYSEVGRLFLTYHKGLVQSSSRGMY
jgi:hypothetical protein